LTILYALLMPSPPFYPSAGNAAFGASWSGYIDLSLTCVTNLERIEIDAIRLPIGRLTASLIYSVSTNDGLLEGSRRLSVLSGYLTSYQAMVWDLFRRGLSQTEIAKDLEVSRQAIHKTVNKANKKVLKALLDTAEINKLDVRRVDPVKGMLVGYSQGFDSRVFLTYGPKNGVQLWYDHQGQCEDCRKREECTSKLLETAEEWKVDLTEEEKTLPPTLLAERLFSEVIEE
jgi:hypothetical protein